MVVISVYVGHIYGVKIILKFWWESGFLKGVNCTNRRSEYLMQLSVNIFVILHFDK